MRFNKFKYKNKKVEIDGMKFDSMKEANRWRELVILQKKQVISDLKRQVRFELIPKQSDERACFYVADFTYTQGELKIVEDTKGFKTPEYIIKRKLLKYRYPNITFIES